MVCLLRYDRSFEDVNIAKLFLTNFIWFLGIIYGIIEIDTAGADPRGADQWAAPPYFSATKDILLGLE